MTTAGVSQLAGDGGEDAFNLFAQADEDCDSYNRDEGKDKGVFDQGLTFLLLDAAQEALKKSR